MTKTEIESYIQDNQELALKKAGQILDREVSRQSFNGIIGGKNGVYHVDSKDYDTPEAYVDAWHKQHEICYEKEKNCYFEKSSHRVHALLKDDFLRVYIECWLMRTYYNKRG